ncbi:MAG: hypothetical protein IT359_16305 [Gemmatimonadaceae bacterium]|nr:hypothetical protein [Gemmatimonadaceae bacterium]
MNIKEWLVRGEGADEREPGAAEVQQAIAADADGVLIADYLTQSLTAGDLANVERRLGNDEDFLARVETIRTAWNAWPRARDFQISDAEREASYQRFLEKWDARGSGESPSVGEGEEGTRDDSGASAADPAHAYMRQLRRWQLAAGILAVLSMGGVTGGAWMGYTASQRLQAPRTYSVEAPARESKVVQVASGVSVSLEAGTRLTWSEAPGPNNAQELFIDGAASVYAQSAPVGRFVVVTPSARLILDRALMHVDATDPAMTRIEVVEGSVVVASRGRNNFPLLSLGAGEQGMAIYNQEPRTIR